MCWRLAMIASLILTCIATPKAAAEPLVAISCDKQNGFNIEYGTTLIERSEAREKNQPAPQPNSKGAY
jgi:hypothetical protein